jgi:hypothetical protein
MTAQPHLLAQQINSYVVMVLHVHGLLMLVLNKQHLQIQVFQMLVV